MTNSSTGDATSKNNSFAGTVVQLVSHLQGLGVRLFLEEGQLRVKAPKGAMTPELVAALKEKKPEVIEFLTTARQAKAAPEESISIIPRDQPIPLSFSQQRLWFLMELDPRSTAYNLTVGIQVKGRINVDGLEQAFNKTVERHEILRTQFRTEGGIPHQVILPCLQVPFERHQLTTADQNTIEARVKELVLAEERHCFNLSEGPLLRVVWIEKAEDDYVVVINMHHIISDGWSTGLLVTEVMTHYQSQLQADSSQSDLPPLKLQYADFSAWQRNRMQGEVLENQLRYWVKHLSGVPSLELPHSEHFPGETAQGGIQEFDFSAEFYSELQTFCKAEEVTPYMVLMSAYQILLSRYTQQSHFAVGSPIANRNSLQLEGVIGYFVNTLAFAASVDDSVSFLDLLKRVKQTTLMGYQNQDVPFEQIVDELKVERDLNTNPLFQVLFSLQNTAATHAMEVGEFTIAPLQSQQRSSKFALRFGFIDTGKALKGEVEFDPNYFSAHTVKQLISSFKCLLAVGIEKPLKQVAQLPLLNSNDGSAILLAAEAKNKKGRAERSVYQQFLQQVSATPDAIAVKTTTNQMTFAQLADRAKGFSQQLICAKQSPESSNGEAGKSQPLVAICMDRNEYYVASILAAWDAGFAYLPLDPQQPRERLLEIINDAQPDHLWLSDSAALISDSMDSSELPKATQKLSELIQAAEVSGDNVEGDEGATEWRSKHAYVIYTSGSSGKPKGVVINHGSLAELACSLKESIYDRHAISTVGLNAPFTFDASVKQLIQVCFGQTLAILSEEERLDVPRLPQSLAALGVDLIDFTPAHLANMLNQMGSSSAEKNRGVLPNVLLIGGENLGYDLWQQIAALENVSAYNLYGPTENTVDTTLINIKPDLPVSMGEALNHVGCVVVDPRGALVPDGFAGELLVTGLGLADGYLQDGSVDSAQFSTKAFIGVMDASETKWYATGDKVRRIANDQYQFVGRLDNQIKLRGHRIELAEIENVLVQHPDVQGAVVNLIDPQTIDSQEKPDQGVQPYLAAYLVKSSQTMGFSAGLVAWDADDVLDIKQFVAAHLPKYMVPDAIASIECIPVTANGKVDRSLLPVISLPKHSLKAAVKPETDLERSLLSVWLEVFKNHSADTLSVEADFFQLGGHSLLAAQLAGRIRERLQIDLPLKAVFENSTIRTLAHWMEIHGTALADIPPMKAMGGAGAFPLTPNQTRLWLLHKLYGGSVAYNMPLVARLTGDLNVAALEKALQAVVDRHQILNVCFFETANGPQQIIANFPQFSLTKVEALSAESLENLVKKELATPFDLNVLDEPVGASAPSLPAEKRLIRGQLISTQYEGQSWVIVLNMHHLISDAASNEVMQRDLVHWYLYYNAQASASQKPADTAISEPEPLSYQFRDYALWQEEWLQGRVLEDQLAYWQKTLEGAPSLEWIPDFNRPAVQTFSGKTLQQKLSKEQAEKVSAVAERFGVTPYVVLLSLFGALVGAYARQEDLVLGTAVSGRSDPALENMVGFFVNTLPVRCFPESKQTLGQLIEQMKQQVYDALSHQHVPFEQVLDALSVERDASRSPLFQVMFNYAHAKGRALASNEEQQSADSLLATLTKGLTVEPLLTNSQSAKYELTLGVAESDQGYALSAEYNSDLFCESTINGMLSAFVGLIKHLPENIDHPLKDINLVPASEWARINGLLIGKFSSYPAEMAVDAWFEQTATRYPEAIAVVPANEGIGLSYDTVNKRANQLAWFLQDSIELNSEAPKRIALVLPRNTDFIVAQLAALKLGFAYVPIDPDYPQERVADILQQAQPQVVLTLAEYSKRFKVAKQHRVLHLCQNRERIQNSQAHNLNRTHSEKDIAYCIFTSGSTGKPKGIEVRHQSLCNLIQWHLNSYQLAPGKKSTLIAGLSFDATVWETWPTLIGGATLMMIPEALRVNASELVNWLDSNAVSHCFLPTPLAEAVYRNWREHRVDLKHLQYLLTGGDRLTIEVDQKLPFEFVNHYGPTEATVVTSCQPLRSSYPKSPPIGSVIDNGYLYLLSPEMKPVPQGAVGELYIGGALLAAGYIGGDQQGAFVADPWKKGKSIYRTGDLVRLNGFDQLEFVDRADGQIQLQGHRIELGEIEHGLKNLEEIADATVLLLDAPIEPGLSSKQIVGYVVAQDAQLNAMLAPQLTAWVRAALSSKLPRYMLPNRVMVIDALPLTANGKIDRRALPEPNWAQAASDQVAAATETEKTLVAIWQEVLGSESVCVEENLFALGASSIQITQLVARVKQEFEVDIELRQVFNDPSIRNISRVIDETLERADTVSVIKVSSKRASGSDEAVDKKAMLQKKLKNLSKEELAELLKKKKAKK